MDSQRDWYSGTGSGRGPGAYNGRVGGSRIGETEVLQNWRCKFMLLENDRRAEIGEVGGPLTVEVAKLEALMPKRV